MELSKRLQMIAQMVSEGNRLADIGTDHGYIPIYLLQNGKIPSAIAMDVGKGPLKRAQDHIQAYCFEDKAVCRLSNGFEQYERGEADTAVIAGMGGDLMTKILDNGRSKLPDELVLQPQSEWYKVAPFFGGRLLRDHTGKNGAGRWEILCCDQSSKGRKEGSSDRAGTIIRPCFAAQERSSVKGISSEWFS